MENRGNEVKFDCGKTDFIPGTTLDERRRVTVIVGNREI